VAALTLAHRQALSPRAQTLAAGLAARPWTEDFYLAGSAALALYVGHRPVADLDLMSNANRLTSPERRDLLRDLVGFDAETEVETARDGYLFARLGGGVGLRLFYYPYPLVQPFADFEGLAVVSAVDLGLMKLGAIISRGSRRDFVDLYFLCRELPLTALLDLAEDKFGHVRDFPLQALKGLADLSGIEGEPMPRLALPLEWSEVEDWVRSQVRELGRTRLGLTPS
jgi:nucleotidyltransferase AbiEii toxin of type IV toxin-antitoxin system